MSIETIVHFDGKLMRVITVKVTYGEVDQLLGEKVLIVSAKVDFCDKIRIYDRTGLD